MKKLKSTLVICLIANLATAQTESSIEINQSGYDNETSVEQEGATYATINQLYDLGHNNSATIFQRGIGNFSYADIDQYGSFNTATITQDGESQSAWIKQGNALTISNNNTAFISQQGFNNSNILSQLNDNNTARLSQVIKANWARQYQESDPGVLVGNTAVAEQYGTSNNLDQYQKGYRNTLYSYQNSEGFAEESSTIQQQDGHCNVAQSSNEEVIAWVKQIQTGNSNVAEVSLNTFFNEVKVSVEQIQTGNSNFAEATLNASSYAEYGINQNQEGDQNTSLVDVFIPQYESFNTTYHVQKGNNNYASSYQNGVNRMYLRQDGLQNYAYSEQYGISNEIIFEQLGGSISSVGEFYQYGEYQNGVLRQQGVENSGKIIQGDINNQTLYGYNEVEQSQNGNNNTAEIRQIKIEQGYVVQAQIGNENNVIASQGVDFEVEVNAIIQRQNGNNNQMSAIQDSTDDMPQFSNNLLEQQQLGDGNMMSSIQLGTENNTYLTQNGDFNSLETSQIGSNNILTITQNGNYNALIIAQEGSGHVNTIMQ